jgi:NAD(P)H dehydrogenase (quinone)
MNAAKNQRCAIIVCHPRIDSYCHALAEQARGVAEAAGFEPVMRELYSMGFDAQLHARDIALHEGGARPAADVEQELQLLDNPAVIVMVYPIWFGSPPGLLKGYIERVLGAGFAGPGTVPVLASRRPQLLVTIATSGASSEWLAQKGVAASAGRTFGTYLAGALHIPRAEHIAIDNVLPNMPETRARAGLRKASERLAAAQVRLAPPDGKTPPHWQTLPSPTA